MSLYRHICETCGKEEILSSQDGFDQGWDYPPRVGVFGIISPRTCGNCPMTTTLWWRMTTGEVTQETLTLADKVLIQRISEEPESILVSPSNS